MNVTVNGREYAVEALPPQHELDDGRPVYRLTGKRGAVYMTIRNRPHPELLFLLKARPTAAGGWSRGFGFGAMEGAWLTDKDGTLRQVRR